MFYGILTHWINYHGIVCSYRNNKFSENMFLRLFKECCLYYTVPFENSVGKIVLIELTNYDFHEILGCEWRGMERT